MEDFQIKAIEFLGDIPKFEVIPIYRCIAIAAVICLGIEVNTYSFDNNMQADVIRALINSGISRRNIITTSSSVKIIKS